MTIAIGDIHGASKLLIELINKLPKNDKLVFLGDYIDRGPDSYGVVEYLIDLAKTRECIFLKGNHESIMEDDYFGKNADKLYNMWKGNGGLDCIASYQDALNIKENISTYELMKDHYERFYSKLQIHYADDKAVYVHGGFVLLSPTSYDEAIKQTDYDKMWVREDFYENPHNWRDERKIIFGHTPIKYIIPEADSKTIFRKEKLIGIDTHAFRTGVLTAYNIDTDEVIQTGL